MPLTEFELIKSRLSSGRRFMLPYSGKDQRAIRRLIDPTGEMVGVEQNTVSMDTSALWGSWNLGLPLDVEEGQCSYIMVNLLVKVHSAMIQDPDFDVKMEDGSDPAYGEMVRQGAIYLWEKNDWLDLDRATLFSSQLSGHGFQRYYWNEDGPQFENVDSWDLALDPHVRRHAWEKLRFGGFRIRMPWDQVYEKYPKARTRLSWPPDRKSEEYIGESCEIWLYYDKDTECHTWQGEVELFRDKNPYEEVPLLTLKGEVNLHSAFRMGDADLATGVQSGLTKMIAQAVEEAENGGPITVYNADAVGTEAQQNDLVDGKLRSLEPVTGMPANEAIHRIPADPVNPAMLDGIKLMRQMADEVQSVNEFMRGVKESGTRTATESALLAQQSGSRGISVKKTVDRFMNKKMAALRGMLVKFGRVDSDSDWELFKAFKSAHSIRVVEGSTNYRDPSLDQQAALQLFNLGAETQQLMAMAGTPWNLRALAEDLLRTFNRGDTQRYFLQVQQQQQQANPMDPNQQMAGNGAAGPPMMPGTAPAGQPQMAQQMPAQAQPPMAQQSQQIQR